MSEISEILEACSISSEHPENDVVLTEYVDKQLLQKWPKLNKGVPDILLHKTADFAQHVKDILALDIKIFQPYLGTSYTKICSQTVKDYLALKQYFDENKLPYHTFSLPNKKTLNIVIRGLPKNVDLDVVKQRLDKASIPVIRMNIMKVKSFAKDQDPLILAVIPHNPEGLKLLKVVKIMGHDVSMEPPKKKTKQCYCCQKWGHSQRYCKGEVKCVKCAGDHFSKECTRDSKSEEPPTCANCGGNHTASYRECFYCPDSEEYQQNRLKKIKNHTNEPKTPRQLVTWENYTVNLYKRITNIPKHNEAIPF